MSSKSFEGLGISHAVSKALSGEGITAPFAIQSLVVPDVLAGRDVLAKSPTGSGKTLAFAAPIVDRIDAAAPRPAALVLAPTRELAAQIVDEARPLTAARSLSVSSVYGGVGLHAQAKRARRAHLVVATPGRLLDLLDRGELALDKVGVLVLDEADRMLDMGFRPDVDRIVSATPRDRQTLFFSATLDGEVGRLADRYTRSARRHEHSPPASRPRIEHRFIGVSREGKLDAVVRELRETEGGRALVFVRTKRGADRLVKRLRNQGLETLAMHGNKSQPQRQKALAALDGGRIDALVATDVAARGIDVAGITHVINFDPPGDRHSYVHRVGRTARAGARGIGVTLVLGDQVSDVAAIAGELGLRHEFRRRGPDGRSREQSHQRAHRPGARRRRRRR
jgi:ATP-dependent RNA helicase RhlE